MNTPNPGSQEAVSEGCKCAQFDNGFGRGSGYRHPETGEPMFWIVEECPLHGEPARMVT